MLTKGDILMEFTTMANGLKLEHSNTVLVYDKQPVNVFLNGNYRINFVFIDDGKEPNIAYNIIDDGLKITLMNFHQMFGTAAAQPLEFASINGTSLYIAFTVQAIGDVKVLIYNIYIKE